LDHRVNPRALDDYAFSSACQNGHTDIVRLLIYGQHSNPSGDGNKAIKFASHSGHLEIVKLLLTCPLVDVTIDDVY
jgi:ankyrin repeat protein